MKSRSIRSNKISPCPTDQYYDSVVERCVDCSAVCTSSTNQRFCVTNCPGYSRQNYGGRSTGAALPQRRLTVGDTYYSTRTSVPVVVASGYSATNPLFHHPLFWTFIVSTTVAAVAFVAIVVLCVIRCRQGRQRRSNFWPCVRRGRPQVDVPTKDQSSLLRKPDKSKSTDSNQGGVTRETDILKSSMKASQVQHDRQQQQTGGGLVTTSPKTVHFTESGWNQDLDDHQISCNLHSDVTVSASVISRKELLVNEDLIPTDSVAVRSVLPPIWTLSLTQSNISTSFIPPTSGSNLKTFTVNKMQTGSESESYDIQHDQLKPVLSNDATNSDYFEFVKMKRVDTELPRPLEVVDDDDQSPLSSCVNNDVTVAKMAGEWTCPSFDSPVGYVSEVSVKVVDDVLPGKSTSPSSSLSLSSLLLVSGASFEKSMQHNRVAYVIQQPHVSSVGLIS